MTRTSPRRRTFLYQLASGLTLAAMAGAGGALAQTSSLTSMKIATIGAGREGGALGTLYAKLGHQVMFSSRHPETLKDLVGKKLMSDFSATDGFLSMGTF